MMRTPVATRARRPDDYAHGIPDNHVTGGVRVGTREDRQRGLVRGHLLGHEAGKLGCGREVAME